MNKIFIALILLLPILISSCSKNETEEIKSVQTSNSENIKFDFTPVNEFMQKYVKGGNVNYEQVMDDNALNKYITQVRNTEPYNIEDGNERLAFWINAYNAFTIKLITDH